MSVGRAFDNEWITMDCLRGINASFWGDGQGDPPTRGTSEVHFVEIEGFALEEGQRTAVAI